MLKHRRAAVQTEAQRSARRVYMRKILVLVALGALFGLGGCGSTSTEGSACQTADATQCAGARTLLVCESSKWTAYPCPSCSGTKCDWKGAANGDACPKGADSYGTCSLDGRLVGCFWSSSANAGVFIESACLACVSGKSLEELGKCTSGRCVCQ
jgi:uncharacterized protein YceK